MSPKGEKHGVAPIGLGACDSLRLEARMPLYGNDISEETSPLEAGLSRFVKLDKESFIGKDFLQKQKEEESSADWLPLLWLTRAFLARAIPF